MKFVLMLKHPLKIFFILSFQILNNYIILDTYLKQNPHCAK